MHYANGDAVKVGDLAVFVEDGQQTVGIVTRLMPSCGTSCNVQIAPIAQSDAGSAPGLWFPVAGQYGWYKTAGQGWPLIAKVVPDTPPVPSFAGGQ